MSCINLNFPPCPPSPPISPELGWSPIIYFYIDERWIELPFEKAAMVAKHFHYEEAIEILEEIDEINAGPRRSEYHPLPLMQHQCNRLQQQALVNSLKTQILDIARKSFSGIEFTIPNDPHKYYVGKHSKIDESDFSVSFNLHCR